VSVKHTQQLNQHVTCSCKVANWTVNQTDMSQTGSLYHRDGSRNFHFGRPVKGQANFG